MKTQEQKGNDQNNTINGLVYESITAITKSLFIDLPTTTIISRTIEFKDLVSNSIAYGIRKAGRAIEYPYLPYPPYLAGCVAGAFKYRIQKPDDIAKKHGYLIPVIGCASTALYEICKDYEQCSGNTMINIGFIIAIETADSVAQYYTGTSKYTSLLAAAGTGVATGVALAASIYLVYNNIEPYITNALSEVNTDKLIDMSNITPFENAILANESGSNNEGKAMDIDSRASIGVDGIADTNSAPFIDSLTVDKSLCNTNYNITGDNGTLMAGDINCTAAH